jgi:uncharacterized protein (DUF1697 family)
MQYVALLRGVNVGGKSLIKMAEIKEAFQKAGFTNVTTYINSGNILFESEITDIEHLENTIEALFEKNFFSITTIVLSVTDIRDVLSQVPKNWQHDDARRYIAFLKNPTKPEEVINQAQLKEGIDSIAKGPRVVYMTTLMSGLTKSGFPRLAGKPIYKRTTIRNYTTVQKFFQLMQK